MKNKWVFQSGSFFSGFNQQKFALPEKYFDEKRFLFRKSFLFLLSSLEFEWFLCPFAKLCLVCQTTDQRRERKTLGKLTFEKFVFLFTKNQFWIWAETTWTFSKTVRHVSQNIAYICRWSLSEIFMEAKIFVWKFSVNERKHRIPSEKVFSGFSKAHFKCPVQHFEKEVMKVKFTFCGLFRALCVFLLRQESESGVSKAQTKCTE